MSSKFENFDIGRSVARFLGIKGIKNFPFQLHTDELQPCLSIPLPDEYTYKGFAPLLLAVDASVTGSYGVELLGQAAENPAIENSGYESELVALDIIVQYDAAGATAMAGIPIGINLTMKVPEGAFNPVLIFQVANWDVPVAGAARGRVFCLDGFSQYDAAAFDDFFKVNARGLLIPPGWGLKANVFINSGFFAANTTLTLGCIFKMRKRKGITTDPSSL